MSHTIKFLPIVSWQPLMYHSLGAGKVTFSRTQWTSGRQEKQWVSSPWPSLPNCPLLLQSECPHSLISEPWLLPLVYINLVNHWWLCKSCSLRPYNRSVGGAKTPLGWEGVKGWGGENTISPVRYSVPHPGDQEHRFLKYIDFFFFCTVSPVRP